MRLVDNMDITIFESVRGLMRRIITPVSSKKLRPSSQAVLAFVVRNINSWKSLNTLAFSATTPAKFEAVATDCGAILRCMFDAYLQARYVVHDLNDCDRRGELFLDYEHIERYRRMRAFDRHKNPYSAKLMSSPLRAKGEPRIKDEYDRVKHAYPGKGPDGVRNHWYPESLWNIASLVGLQEEYDWFLSVYHGSIHTSPMTSRYGPPLPGPQLLYIGLPTLGNSTRLLVLHESIPMSRDDEELLNSCAGDLLAMNGSS